MHTKLLLELIEFFYDAKLREQLQRQNAYVQAIHETGARLTHDVKNLLQSLTTLCAAAESSEAEQAEALQALIKRQLPLITQRLEQTLKKLKAPHKIDKEEIKAADWWRELIARYGEQQIEFQTDDEIDGTLVPGELFDSVADNLLQNALKKRAAQPGIVVRVSFLSGPRRTFTVCDTGTPMDSDKANKLFDAPIASNTGLGIGLYQAARQAEQLGYQLHIAHNELGRVCFELRPTLKLVVGGSA
jgi:signal transduction histidine kinase